MFENTGEGEHVPSGAHQEQNALLEEDALKRFAAKRH
jgi:hypothetical protein